MANNEKAASSKVTIALKNELNIELETNNPDIDGLIKEVIANRETIEPGGIKVDCDDEKFDCKSFQEIIQKVVKDLMNDISIEETAISNAQTWINERNQEEDEDDGGDKG